jgi:cystathionine beta-lyase family protein involved in aluminum resistance
MGATYDELPLKDKKLDFDGLKKIAKNYDLIMLQRSRGYQDRPSLLIKEIQKASEIIKEENKDAIIFVDNCYGEFVEEMEPIEAGAHVMVGSLIKNAGGGIVEAAQIAKEAKVKEMWLTHYSPSLNRPEEYMDKVREIFPHAKAGKDGMSVELLFEEN